MVFTSERLESNRRHHSRPSSTPPDSPGCSVMVIIVTNCGKLPQAEAEVSTAAGRVSLTKNDDNHKQNHYMNWGKILDEEQRKHARLAGKTLREIIKKKMLD